MDSLIRFRQNVESLSDKELTRFIFSNGRNNIINILFKHYLNSIQLPATVNDGGVGGGGINNLRSANNLITRIILSRKPKAKEKKEEFKNEMKMDELPCVMIGKISSFLDFKSILQFERCDRFIFTAIRAMPSTDLTAKYFMKYLKNTANANNEPFYDLERFRSNQELIIDIEAGAIADDCIPKVTLKELTPCKNLSSLKVGFLVYNQDFQSFEKYIFDQIQQMDNLSSIKSFSFAGFIDDESRFEDFILGIRQMINLEECHIYIANEHEIDSELLSFAVQRLAIACTKLSKVRAFSIRMEETPNLNSILKAIGNQLQTLDLCMMYMGCDPQYDGGHFVDVKLSNLTELCLCCPSKKCVDNLIQHCDIRKLKKLIVQASYDETIVTEEYCQCLIPLFSLTSITNICISADNDGRQDILAMMMRIVGKAIEQNKYEHLIIDLHSANKVWNDFIAHLDHLLRILSAQCVCFELRCEFTQSNKYEIETDKFVKGQMGKNLIATCMKYLGQETLDRWRYEMSFSKK